MPTFEEEIDAARSKWVAAGKWKFQIRRPDEIDTWAIGDLQKKGKVGEWNEPLFEKLLTCVTDWKVPGEDVLPGRGKEVPKFEFGAFRKWIRDYPDIYVEIGQAVISEIADHRKKLEDTQKK